MSDPRTHELRDKSTGALLAEAVDPNGYDPDAFDLVPLPEGYWDQRATDTAWTNLRAARDRLLAATDWTQTLDHPTPFRNRWAAYREELRNMPDNTIDPKNPTWPQEPSRDRNV